MKLNTQLFFTTNRLHKEEDMDTEKAMKEATLNNRAPKCARCRNHGLVNSLKGHKHFCQWKNCTCSRCQVVVERQRITASRVASLRQQRKMSETRKSKKGASFLRFAGSPDSIYSDRKLINLNSVKYLSEIKKYRFIDSGKFLT